MKTVPCPIHKQRQKFPRGENMQHFAKTPLSPSSRIHTHTPCLCPKPDQYNFKWHLCQCFLTLLWKICEFMITRHVTAGTEGLEIPTCGGNSVPAESTVLEVLSCSWIYFSSSLLLADFSTKLTEFLSEKAQSVYGEWIIFTTPTMLLSKA